MDVKKLWATQGYEGPVCKNFEEGCLAAQKYLNKTTEMVASAARENQRTIDVLVAAGFINEDKVNEARNLVRNFDD